MDVTQAAALLAIASEADGRKPNPDAAKFWAEVLAGVRFDDAREAVFEHYRSEHRWIMPSDVLKGVAKIVKARQEARQNTDLPAELEGMDDGPEFTAAYLEWQRTGRVAQRQLTA